MERALFYQLGSQEPLGFEELQQEVELAEALGLDAVWCFPAAGEQGDFQGSVPAIWLSGLSSRTERIRLGWGLPGLLPPTRPPIRIAEQAASLDIAANGRLDVAFLPDGLLEGTQEAPWDEGVRMLVEMWAAPAFSWTSERFKVMPVDVVPKPRQRPHPPLSLAGWSPDHAMRAGQGGLGFLDFSGADDETLAVHLAAYTEARAGADPDDLVSGSAFAVAGEVGPDAEATRRLSRWEEMGVDRAIVRAGPLEGGHAEATERIRFLSART